jgi:hypothetical protein
MPETDDSWKLKRRRAQLSPERVAAILLGYMSLLEEIGLKRSPIQGERARILKELALRHNTSYHTIVDILNRRTWRTVNIPDNWIPFK